MAIQSGFLPIADSTDLLLRAALSTLELTAIGAVLGVSIGIVGALILVWNTRPLAAVFRVYVESIRNTPFLMQLLCIFFGLPSLGVPISGWQAAVLAMVINLGAHATDTLHASFPAFPGPRDETWRHNVLLPALNNAWPALSNQIIVIMLGSAVCSQIGTQELSFAADVLQSRNLRVFETYALITLMYLCMALMIRQLLNWIGQRFLAPDRVKACASVAAHE